MSNRIAIVVLACATPPYDELIDAIVVHTGPRAYRRTDGIAVVPAALLGP